MAATRRRPRWRFGARAVGAGARGAALAVGAAVGAAEVPAAAARAVAAAGAVARGRFVAICEGILYYLFCEGTLA